jgi:hypothetical protein
MCETFAAILVCSIMYYGELMLLDGKLYRFGQSFLFQGLPFIAVSPADIMIILFSGIVTAFLMNVARENYRYMRENTINQAPN